MPKKRSGVPPLRPIRRNPKPCSQLQLDFLAHQNNNLNSTEETTPVIREFLMRNSDSDVSPMNQLHGRTASMEDVGLDNLPESYEDEQLLDPEGGPAPGEDLLDPMLEAMSEARYQAARLEQRKKWQSQYAQMLPSFLRCRLWTSSWGDPTLWDHDYTITCDCPKSRVQVRQVDLVDTHTRKQVDVQFCACRSDHVRLVEMGYMGASPAQPRTAFSLRLLQMHHVIWKYSAISTCAFADAIDDLLDRFNPLILIKGTGRARGWRVPLSAAIDAYRSLLDQVRQLEYDKLQLDALGQLAANCPQCFGPPVDVTNEDEPDIVLSEDGNFQHKRHATASVPIPGYEPPVPELFVPSKEVQDMAEEMTRLSLRANARGHDDAEVHPCTESHTAANDTRGHKDFGGVEQTGLFVLGCRHDHSLRFIDIVQSGEKSYFALTMMRWIFKVLSLRNHNIKVGFLYDIGCNIEKGIIKRDQFSEERARGCLKIATSVFHAYAHEWGCQLDYNPRLNKGWGLSDGEGSERIWYNLSPLISSNRYATNEHRLVNINLRAIHHNDLLRKEAVRSMATRGLEVRRRLHEADRCLIRLQGVDPMYSTEYFESQWERQRSLQKAAINRANQEQRARLTILLNLEESLYEARQELEQLNTQRARTQTVADRRALLNIPRTLTTLETKMNELASELGSAEFLQLTGSSDPRAKPLLTIQLAKSKLYEAKQGVLQHYDQSHVRTGTRDQPVVKERGAKKAAALRRKYNTYHRHVSKYNQIHCPVVRLADPTFDEVQALPITDEFWDGNGLSHPDEVWATNSEVKTGIQAFLTKRAAVEEIRRIGREVRQLVLWALNYQARVNDTQPETNSTTNLHELQGLHAELLKSSSRLWMRWDPELQDVLRWTAPYVQVSSELDITLKEKWSVMIQGCSGQWAKLVGQNLMSADVEAEDVVDQSVLRW